MANKRKQEIGFGALHNIDINMISGHQLQNFTLKTNSNGFGHQRSSSKPIGMSKSEAEEKTWSSEWRNFADGVAISGMRFITDTDLPVLRRIIWTLLVFIGAGLMTYQLVERITHYYSYPKATVLEKEYPKDLQFPAITLCNENRVEAASANTFGMWELYKTLNWPFDHPVTPKPSPAWHKLDDFYAQNPKNEVDWREMEGRLAQQAINSIFFCRFDNKECTVANLTYTFTEVGRCFTFNNDKKWRSSQSGALNGFVIMANLGQGNYLAPVNFLAGFRVLPHDPDEHPDMLNRGILIPPGFGVNLEISPVQTHLLGPPYGKCDPNIKLQYIPKYTVDGCLYECKHLYLRMKCGCISVGFSDYAVNDTVCDPREEYECLQTEQTTFFKDSLVDSVCYCPPACNSTTYTYTSSQAVFSDIFVDAIVTAFASIPYFTKELFIKDNVVINVYFPAISNTKVSEEPAYDIFTLFCDMGGALGLLLGSTFLTLYKFLDFFVFTALYVRNRE